jgi:hypothetical protein
LVKVGKLEPRHLDFKIIAQDLEDLLAALENKLEREAGKVDQLALLYFVPAARIVRNTWKTIQYFSADTPVDHKRKREFALSAAPLNRSILDIVFNSVFLLEDPASRFRWLVKAGWREQKVEYERPDEPRRTPTLETVGDAIASQSGLRGHNPRADVGHRAERRLRAARLRRNLL